MIKVALLVRLEAKPGKESAVEDFLRDGLPLVQQEPATSTWYAIKLGSSTYGIFDTFPDAWSLAGMAIIAGSGLLITLHERRRSTLDAARGGPVSAVARSRAPAAGRPSNREVSEVLRRRSDGGAGLAAPDAWVIAILPSGLGVEGPERVRPLRCAGAAGARWLGQRRPFAASAMTSAASAWVTKPGPVMISPVPSPVGRFRVCA